MEAAQIHIANALIANATLAGANRVNRVLAVVTAMKNKNKQRIEVAYNLPLLFLHNRIPHPEFNPAPRRADPLAAARGVGRWNSG